MDSTVVPISIACVNLSELYFFLKALKFGNIGKYTKYKVSTHNFRHCFASKLLEFQDE